MQYNLAWSCCQSRAVGDWQPLTGFHPNAVWTLKFKQKSARNINRNVEKLPNIWKQNTKIPTWRTFWSRLWQCKQVEQSIRWTLLKIKGVFCQNPRGGGGSKLFGQNSQGTLCYTPIPPPSHLVCIYASASQTGCRQNTSMCSLKFLVKWAPLNGITDNGIYRLMGSTLSHLTNPRLPFST
jgi:hypothetical protein